MRGVRSPERIGFQHPEAEYPLIIILSVIGDIPSEALRLDAAGLLVEANEIDPDVALVSRLGQDRSHLIGGKSCSLLGYTDDVRTLPDDVAQTRLSGEKPNPKYITPFSFVLWGEDNGMINYHYPHAFWGYVNVAVSFDYSHKWRGYYFEIDRGQGVLFGAEPDTYQISDD